MSLFRNLAYLNAARQWLQYMDTRQHNRIEYHAILINLFYMELFHFSLNDELFDPKDAEQCARAAQGFYRDVYRRDGWTGLVQRT